MSQHAPFGMAPPDHMQDNSFNNFNQHPMQQTPFQNGPFQGGFSHRGGNHFGRGGNHNGFRGGNNGSENFKRDRKEEHRYFDKKDGYKHTRDNNKDRGRDKRRK